MVLPREAQKRAPGTLVAVARVTSHSHGHQSPKPGDPLRPSTAANYGRPSKRPCCARRLSPMAKFKASGPMACEPR